MSSTVKKDHLVLNILGTEYNLSFKHFTEDEQLKLCSGYTDVTTKSIVVATIKDTDKSVDDMADQSVMQRKTVRHEIIHAYLYESGLFENSSDPEDGWANNEEMVDWIAIQFPKILKTITDANAL
jgi:hypothetical protein